MLQRVRERAQQLGVTIDRHADDASIIRAIQQAEGRAPCFATERNACCRGNCDWATECRGGLVAEWLR